MVYLPMGYLYGSRFIYSNAETDPLIAELRNEVCMPVINVYPESIVNKPSPASLLYRIALWPTVRFNSVG